MRNKRDVVIIIAILALACCFVSKAAYASGTALDPLGLNNINLGGGALNIYTPGVEGGTGLNNIGLLVRTWGKVTFVDTTAKFFYIDDGSGLLDGSGYIGVRVSYNDLTTPPNPNVITPPIAGISFVAVTGISSTIKINEKIRPMLRPRRQSDIQQF